MNVYKNTTCFSRWSVRGIQQAQAIAQISVILGDPITENKTIESGD